MREVDEMQLFKVCKYLMGIAGFILAVLVIMVIIGFIRRH